MISCTVLGSREDHITVSNVIDNSCGWQSMRSGGSKVTSGCIDFVQMMGLPKPAIVAGRLVALPAQLHLWPWLAPSLTESSSWEGKGS